MGTDNVIHLGERDCSVQRRYQKLIEETPAPRPVRDAATAACTRPRVRLAADSTIAARAPWSSWSTGSARCSIFWKMNARIQVEHPVTEAVTGVDIVAEQIAIAEGSGLRLPQADIRPHGCASNAASMPRIPTRDFRPKPGPGDRGRAGRAAPAYAWIRTSVRTRACRRTMIR